MQITFYGAAGHVTGSKHMLMSEGGSLLLDCGMYQGKKDVAYELNKALPFDATGVDAVILSHAHADHCGLLPLLVKSGFRNSIYATPATIDISKLIMMDSAHLQENDYKRMLEGEHMDKNVFPPVYTPEDVESVSPHFLPVEYAHATRAWQTINDHYRFKFYDAGHILGSAITVLEYTENTTKKTLAFTGDLGNTHVPILPEPEIPIESIDMLIIECTYGNSNHPSMDDAETHLKELIANAVLKKQKLIVPAFSLGRTQELLYVLHRMYKQGVIPAIPVYVDSPLSIDITKVYDAYPNDFDHESWVDFLSHHESPFSFKNLKCTNSVEESKALNQLNGPCMIIASSGMAEGGRIVHHIEQNVSNPNAVIVITGYQAEFTLGRMLQEKISPIRIHHADHELRAQVVTLHELSAHADQTGLLSFISKLKGLKKVFLVHAEPPQAKIFEKILSEKFPSLDVCIPTIGQIVDL